MHRGFKQVLLTTAVVLPLLGAPQDFVCKNADECTEALKLGLPGSLERLTALAEGGDAAAQVKLGMYFLGHTKSPSLPRGDSWVQGTKWLMTAAYQGSRDAQFILAKTLSGADRLRFFRFAAEQGHAEAQLELSFNYSAKGDLVQYRKWFLLAVKDLPKAFQTDGIRVSEMTPEQIAESDRLAREWEPKTWAELRAADDAN